MREELDYVREAKHARLYQHALGAIDEVRVPDIVDDLSTKRLLTLGWLQGEKDPRLQGGAGGGAQPARRSANVQGLVAPVSHRPR